MTSRTMAGILLIASIFFSCGNASAAPKIRLVTLDWAPYIGEKLPGKGYIFEIVVEAFRKSGYETEIIFYPWERSLRIAQSGQVDGLFPEYFDQSRLDNFVYSRAIPGGPLGLYARKDSNIRYTISPLKNQTVALRGLAKYKFGVVRGYLNTKEFDSAQFLMKEPADSDATNLRKLYAKRVDLIVIDKYVARYLIQTNFPQYGQELEFIEPPLEIKPLFIAFSKKTPDVQQKLNAFNRGLRMIENNGTLKSIMKKNGF